MTPEPLTVAAGQHFSEQVIARIARLVAQREVTLDGRFPSERALEIRWRVSRVVIREAFRALELQGVVESRRGGGRFLRSELVPDSAALRRRRLEAGRAQLLELWEVREVLECRAAALAATRASPDELATIAAGLRLMTGSPSEAMPQADGNLAFHLAIARACGNAMLLDLITALLARSQAIGFRNLVELDVWASHQPEHQPIHDAIAAGDPALATVAMQAHFEGLRRSLCSGE